MLFVEKQFPDQNQECNEGNREYKLKLNSNHKIYKIASQLRYRLYEGDGKALYIVGIQDNGKTQGIPLLEIFEAIIILSEACSILSKTEKGEKGKDIIIQKVRIYNGNNDSLFVATIRITGIFGDVF